VCGFSLIIGDDIIITDNMQQGSATRQHLEKGGPLKDPPKKKRILQRFYSFQGSLFGLLSKG
jgi:hypothetical protein